MIFVNRDTVPEPSDLVVLREEELAEVRAYYDPENVRRLREAAATAKPVRVPARAANRKGKPRSAKAKGAKDPKGYGFKAYLAAKKELERLFHKKCAYCELKYKAGLTGEVEHYRPKGRILAGGRKSIWPGYYWLAATWTNLVPVCSMCNKLNKVVDLTDGTERTTGKGERFYLADEAFRAKPEEDPAAEDPLLLNPCVHDPTDHLTFIEREGHRALLSGQTDKGRHTVEILGLNRADLVERRLERLLAMEALMTDIQAAHGRLARAATELDREEAIAEIQAKRDKLIAYQNDNQEFAALARHTVPAFLAKMQEITQSAANE